MSPVLNNKELFDSQRSTTPESSSADSPTPVGPPSNQSIPSTVNNFITSSSSEEELPSTPPERVIELERRRKNMDLGEEAVRNSDFASEQVLRNTLVISLEEQE